MDALDLKTALEGYHEYHRLYRQSVERLEELNGRRFKSGSSIIKIVEGSFSREKIIINNLSKLDKIERDRNRYFYYINLVDIFIGMCPSQFKRIVEDKYIHSLTNQQLEMKYGYSVRQINRIVSNLIEKFAESI